MGATAASVVNKQNDDLERSVGVYLFNHAYVCCVYESVCMDMRVCV